MSVGRTAKSRIAAILCSESFRQIPPRTRKRCLPKCGGKWYTFHGFGRWDSTMYPYTYTVSAPRYARGMLVNIFLGVLKEAWLASGQILATL